MSDFPPLLANETLMCAHGGKVNLATATKTKKYKFENSNSVLQSELMQAMISGCPMPTPPAGPGPCTKIVMIPPTSLAQNIQVGDAKGDAPVLTNVAGMITDRGVPVQYIPAGQRKVKFGMAPAIGQAAKVSIEAAEAYEAAEEMDAAEAAGEKIRKLSIRDVFWKNADGEVITKAHIGDTVYLTARLKYCEENKVDIKIMEKDFDNADDLIKEMKGEKLQKSKMYKRQKELRLEWKVTYTQDNDDRSSTQELELEGYTLPEYYFVFTVKDNEGKKVQSHSSLMLKCMDKMDFEEEGEAFEGTRSYIFLHPDGRTIAKECLKEPQKLEIRNLDISANYYMLAVSEPVGKFGSPMIFTQTSNAVDVDESVRQKAQDVYDGISDFYKDKNEKETLIRPEYWAFADLAKYIAATGNLAAEEYLYQITEEDFDYLHLVQNYLKRNEMPEFEWEIRHKILRKLIIQVMSTVCPTVGELEKLPTESYFLLLPPEGYGFSRNYKSKVMGK